MIMRLAALALGYMFGVFQTGYIYGKIKGVDIRTQGSGNTGTTNTLRILGKKAGIIAFVGDFLKAVIPIIIVKLCWADYFDGDAKVLELYAGLGAVLGHNYPFYLKFKGGKGIASTAGVAFFVCPPAVPVCLLDFILCLVFTKYVSVGSITMATLFIVQVWIFNAFGILGITETSVLEVNILVFIFGAMAILRHKDNIVRLMNGTENKIGKKKE